MREQGLWDWEFIALGGVEYSAEAVRNRERRAIPHDGMDWKKKKRKLTVGAVLRGEGSWLAFLIYFSVALCKGVIRPELQ